MCRRALVFVRGSVTAELSGPDLTVAELTRAASAMPLAGTATHPDGLLPTPSPAAATEAAAPPGRPGGPRRPHGPGAHLIGRYGLLALTALLFLIFSLALPRTFPRLDTVDAVLSTQSIPAVLALAAMVPIVTGSFDLSLGYGLGLAHVMVMQLVVNNGWPWPLACLAVILGGAVVGILNGVIVEFGRINSFIATLGTGSMLYAVTGWVTDGGRIVPSRRHLPSPSPTSTTRCSSAFPSRPSTYSVSPSCSGWCWNGCRSAATCTSSGRTGAPPTSSASRHAGTPSTPSPRRD